MLSLHSQKIWRNLSKLLVVVFSLIAKAGRVHRRPSLIIYVMFERFMM